MDINNYVEIIVKYTYKDGRIIEQKSKFPDSGGPGTVVSPLKSVEAQLGYFILHQIM